MREYRVVMGEGPKTLTLPCAFAPSRTRIWGVYWAGVPETTRWFSTRRGAEGYGRDHFRGSVWFVTRAYYPPASKGTAK